MKYLIFSVLFFFFYIPLALACPSTNGIADYNCDGDVKIGFIGDSLVYGTGDMENGDRGGYPLRLSRKYRNVEMVNAGVSGLNTRQLLLKLDTAFKTSREATLRNAILDSDIVIIDIGRNDRWFFGAALDTYRNLKRIRSKVVSASISRGKPAPLVVTAVMMLPNRGSQGPWMKILNNYILKGDSNSYPADLRFDLVSKRLINSDGIHPSSKGYDALSKVAASYLTKTLKNRLKSIRPDSDKDGIYDYWEIHKYGTDPALSDTDSDGHSDGDEVFHRHSDPLVAD